MYKTQVNNNINWTINNSVDTILDNQDKIVISKNENGSYLALINGLEVIADLQEINEEDKTITLKIDQQKYVVSIEEPGDILLKSVGVAINTTKKIANLKSAMPGLVLQVLVKPGDAVKKGDTLVIVEAMKMENLFKATADATVADVKITEKQIIEKGQELIVFEN